MTEEEKTGLQILVGNGPDIIKLLEQLTYNKARQTDVVTALAWIQKKLR